MPKPIEGTLLEHLAEMSAGLRRGLKLSRLAGYIDGYLAARIQLGSPDRLANELFAWLTERGDETAVIRRLLELAAEFTATNNEDPDSGS